jgi:hypothetical protein
MVEEQDQLKQRNIKFTDDEWERIKKTSRKLGFSDRSNFIRNEIIRVVREEEEQNGK